jgi:nitrite reductase/ring-hydroxylating ferredoxin subunit
MPEPKIRWIKIADSKNEIEFQSNNMCVIEAGDKKITLADNNGQLCAFAYKCPHASGVLADGFIDAAGNVVCPLHRYKFNMTTGRNVTGEGYYLAHYHIKEEADGIYIGFEQKGIFGF